MSLSGRKRQNSDQSKASSIIERVENGERTWQGKFKSSLLKHVNTSNLRKIENQLDHMEKELGISTRERKMKWTSYTNLIDYNASVSLDCLSVVANGTALDTRTGDEVMVRSLEINYFVYSEDSALSKMAVVRLIVFQWIPNNLVLPPTPVQLLQYIGSILSPLAPYNREKFPMFRILLDQGMNVGALNKSASAFNIITTGFVNNRKIHFNTGLSTGTHQIYALAISNVNADHPTITFSAKIHYIDA